MSIQTRLLVAFVPLVIICGLMIAILSFAARQANMIVTQRTQVINDVLSAQDLISLMLIERDRLGQYLGGDENALDQVLLTQAEASALADDLFTRDGPLELLDREIASDYLALSRRHNEILRLAQAEGIEAAQIRLNQPDVDSVIAKVIERSREARQVSEFLIQQVDQRTIDNQFRNATILITVLLIGLGLGILISFVQISAISRSLARLTNDAERYASGEAAGELSQPSSIRELGQLRNAFQYLLNTTVARQERLKSSLGEIEQRMQRENMLRDTVQALAVPVIPLGEESLLLPLIGYLDEDRADQVSRTLLKQIREQRARKVVLDLTGLVDVRAETAFLLKDIANAAMLLGSQVVLVGVRAEQALALVESGLSKTVATERDIPGALSRSS